MKSSIFSHNCISNNQSLITDTTRGEVLCSQCGLVIAEKITDSQYGTPVPTKEAYLTKTRVEGKSKVVRLFVGNLDVQEISK